MVKKLFSTIICFAVLISTLSFPAYAINNPDETSLQLGFSISKNEYAQFGYIIEHDIINYYNGQEVGTTTYSYSYCRGKQKALGYYSDLCALKVVTEPNTITLNNSFLFFNWKSKHKFRIDSLGIESDKSNLNTSDKPFKVNNVTYNSSAISATDSSTTSKSISLSALGSIGITVGGSVTVDKSIVDIANLSNSKKAKIAFIFGTPTTLRQNQCVYEQTSYYILQEYLSYRKSYTNVTAITAKFSCDNITSTRTLTISTPLKF